MSEIPEAGGGVSSGTFNAPDGARIFYRRWHTDGEPVAALHLVHGMAEHGGRYDRLARRLVARGVEVWAMDLRGHGRTADPALNDPERGGVPGHCGGAGALDAVLGDIAGFQALVRRSLPGGAPLFTLGHSWGSFLSLAFAEEHPGMTDGLILSGTRGPGGAAVAAGRLVLGLVALLLGRSRPSALSRAICDGPFNHPFRPNRTRFDWLSRDNAEVDAYVADPASGVLCSAGFYLDLMRLLARIHRNGALAAVPKDLPVYVYAGSADPVGDRGKGPTALVAAFRICGIRDLEFVLYPGARHEMHNETNREEVTADLIGWIEKHLGAVQ